VRWAGEPFPINPQRVVALGQEHMLADLLDADVVVLAKLCGEDKPMGIVEWAKHRKEELIKLLRLNWARVPHHNTCRRILAHKVYEQELEIFVNWILSALNENHSFESYDSET